MRTLSFVLPFVLASCSGSDGSSTIDPNLRPEEHLALEVKVEGQPRVGEALKLDVQIRNVGDRAVDVLPPLDGSDGGRRFPHYIVRLEGPDGREVHMGRAICGNCTALQKGDIISLKPGEGLDPISRSLFGNWLSRVPHVPGKHRLTLMVDFSATDPGEWNGFIERMEADGAVVAELLARVPRQKLEKFIEFDVVPRERQAAADK